MYTIKVENNGVLNTTVADALIKGGVNTNAMHILVPQMYTAGYEGEYDMRRFNASMLYTRMNDSSGKYNTIRMNRVEDLYKDKFVEYRLPNNSELTSKAGIIICKFVFEYTDVMSGKYFYRDTFPTEIEVFESILDYNTKPTENNGNNTSQNQQNVPVVSNIAGIKSEGGEIFLVDNDGNRIGESIAVESTQTSVASNLQVIRI